MAAPTIGENWAQLLFELPKGWDSYGGSPITLAAIDTVKAFSTVPCSDGGIQLEIHQDGFDIEIVIGPDGQIKSALVCCEPKESA